MKDKFAITTDYAKTKNDNRYWVKCYISSFEIVSLRLMRVIGEIAHPEIKITLFHWNNRYLIKLEAGLLEQTYKIQEFDVASENDLKKIVSTEFVENAIRQFNSMNESLILAMQNL